MRRNDASDARPRFFLAGQAHVHELIAEHAGGAIGLGKGPRFGHHEGTVVTQPADVAAARVDDLVEQSELGIAAVHDIQMVGFDRPLQH